VLFNRQFLSDIPKNKTKQNCQNKTKQNRLIAKTKTNKQKFQNKIKTKNSAFHDVLEFKILQIGQLDFRSDRWLLENWTQIKI
jgi:hypothetical protein